MKPNLSGAFPDNDFLVNTIYWIWLNNRYPLITHSLITWGLYKPSFARRQQYIILGVFIILYRTWQNKKKQQWSKWPTDKHQRRHSFLRLGELVLNLVDDIAFRLWLGKLVFDLIDDTYLPSLAWRVRPSLCWRRTQGRSFQKKSRS